MNEPLISIDPEIHSGTPVFNGSRVPIKTLFDHLSAGDSLDVFLGDFPSVSRELAVAVWEQPQMPLFAQAGGFVNLPKRWVVERTHAWLERERRMVMHHDRSTQNAIVWAWLAQSRMLLRRLADHG